MKGSKIQKGWYSWRSYNMEAGSCLLHHENQTREESNDVRMPEENSSKQ
jgi:hypothetical protein